MEKPTFDEVGRLRVQPAQLYVLKNVPVRTKPEAVDFAKSDIRDTATVKFPGQHLQFDLWVGEEFREGTIADSFRQSHSGCLDGPNDDRANTTTAMRDKVSDKRAYEYVGVVASLGDGSSDENFCIRVPLDVKRAGGFVAFYLGPAFSPPGLLFLDNVKTIEVPLLKIMNDSLSERLSLGRL